MQRTKWENLGTQVLQIVKKYRRPGENAVECLRRLALNEALAKAYGCQKEAAVYLYSSWPTVARWAKDLQLRPVDQVEQEVRRANGVDDVDVGVDPSKTPPAA